MPVPYDRAAPLAWKKWSPHPACGTTAAAARAGSPPRVCDSPSVRKHPPDRVDAHRTRRATSALLSALRRRELGSDDGLVARAKQKPAVVRPLMLTGASAERHASSSRFPAVHLLKPS